LFARAALQLLFLFFISPPPLSHTHLSLIIDLCPPRHAKVLAGWLAGRRERAKERYTYTAGSACMTVVLQMRACIFHDRSNSAVGF
jgi:hypothetical protein